LLQYCYNEKREKAYMTENARDRHAEMLSQGYDAGVIREAPDLESGAEDASLVEVQNFLKHYGYLDYEPVAQGETPEAGRLDDVTVRALTEFQRRYNVGTPGTLDDPTREFMAAPRCGMQDVLSGASPFFSTRCAWNRRNLTYAFGNLSGDVTNDVARAAVRRAFNSWAGAGVGLSFTEVATTANPDIFVEWRQANDPDLSMVGNTLAHADFPPGCTFVVNPPNGTPPTPVHFDDQEHAWADGAVASSFDIETVALHEIGHVLGLQHTTVSGSVMFPSVSSNFTLRALQADDNAGIRALYPPASGRVMVADFGDGNPPAEVRYWENWGQSNLLNGWHDAGDIQLAGDFRGLGHDQVLFINRGGSGGRVMIADFGDGNPPAEVRYWENWGQSNLLNGWHDAGDIQLVGDFLGLGRDQVLFINRGGSGGRVMVADFSGGVPAQVRYWENWGQSNLLNGWHDAGDIQLVGDFRGLGRDQVLFINRGGSGGRVMIADFGDGHPPAEVRYWENWGQSNLLNGWHDANDLQMVGSFMGPGRQQVLFLNRTA
jgi:hypothetical protein